MAECLPASRAGGSLAPGRDRATGDQHAMIRQLQRISRMSRAELSWRARTAGRTLRESLAVLLQTPRWERETLANVLDPAAVDERLLGAIQHRDWTSAHEQLA